MTVKRSLIALVVALAFASDAHAQTSVSIISIQTGAGPNPGEKIIIVFGSTTLDAADTSATKLTVTLTDPNGANVAIANQIWTKPTPGTSTNYNTRSVPVTVTGTYTCVVRFDFVDAIGLPAMQSAKVTFEVK